MNVQAIVALTDLGDPSDSQLKQLLSDGVPAATLAATAYVQLDKLIERSDPHSLKPQAGADAEGNDELALFDALTRRLRTLTSHKTFKAQDLEQPDLAMLLASLPLFHQLLTQRVQLRPLAHEALVAADDTKLNQLLKKGADPTWLADRALRLLKRAQSDRVHGYHEKDVARDRLMGRLATLADRGVVPAKLGDKGAEQVWERLQPFAKAAAEAAKAGNADAAFTALAGALETHRWPLPDDAPVPALQRRHTAS